MLTLTLTLTITLTLILTLRLTLAQTLFLYFLLSIEIHHGRGSDLPLEATARCLVLSCLALSFLVL
jgi:hypothetical protein